MQIISTRIVETKPWSSKKFFSKGKEKEEEIVIPNWDISNLNPNQMHIFGELLQKKAKQQRLRDERNKEFQIIEDAKKFLTETQIQRLTLLNYFDLVSKGSPQIQWKFEWKGQTIAQRWEEVWE